MEEVILVDAHDREIGQMEKLKAHQEGRLHRAVSVCLFHPDGRWLLQRRAEKKYHSPGLLSNSCCSHPRPGESIAQAASRRVVEELGISCPLRYSSSFIYQTDVGGGLVEHEFDHLFTGTFEGSCFPNADEVDAVVWWEAEKIRQALEKTPWIFTKWFPIIFEHVRVL